MYKIPITGNGSCGPSCEDSLDKTNNKSFNNKNNSQWQHTYEINENLDVILQGRIGEGFYGEVYKGTLRRRNGKEVDSEQDVAVKKLKTQEDSENVLDFEREIKIMEVNHCFNNQLLFLQSSLYRTFIYQEFLKSYILSLQYLSNIILLYMLATC